MVVNKLQDTMEQKERARKLAVCHARKNLRMQVRAKFR
jgi:hypothetical protein